MVDRLYVLLIFQDILGESEKADLGDIHSYSSQLMEKLLDKKDAKSIIYVLRNLESKEKVCSAVSVH
jgi:hypothetical protein